MTATSKRPTTNAATPRRFRFSDGMEVDRLGFGTMRLTGQPGNFGPYPHWEDGLVLLRRAADLGVTFFDSARSYGPLHADRLVGEALEGRDVVIATKGGVDKPAEDRIAVDGSPETLHREIEEARHTLRRDRIDLFQLHRVDPEVEIERSVEALARAQDAGQVRHIGLSNVTREDLDRALTVAPIASVQNRYNMGDADEGDALVDYTAERRIAFIPHGPLGANPMKHGAALAPSEAIAWLLKRSSNIVVIPGTTSRRHLEENVAAWDLVAAQDREGEGQ